ncbi:hypothetical protein FRC07_005818 [Ceratobasidium sp. 392]|nr:hypothetical protein FRC07_005818 [Ceratobasidium sp. 392]
MPPPKSSLTSSKQESDSPHYSDEQLRALYKDLFASPFPPLPLLFTPATSPGETLYALRERFNLEYETEPTYKTVIDHVERALEFIAIDKADLPKLGLVLDSEWEAIVKAALDARDIDYGLKVLEIMVKYGVELPENLDGRLLEHDSLLDVDQFVVFSDKLTEIGYPLTPERISRFINIHLQSLQQSSFEHVKDAQNLIHKFEAQGTPPSQAGYAYVINAYLDLSRESDLLSGANPSAAIAAAHDLFAHMRYVAHPVPSLKTYSLIISACSRGHQVNPLRALELLKEVRDGLLEGKPHFLQPKLDTRSLIDCYNGAIRACARAGPRFAGDAFRLAKELVQRDGIPVAGTAIGKIGPDRTTMTALMHSAKRMGDLGRTRWILTEVMRAQTYALQQAELPRESETILDEEIMVCVFQTYSAFRPPFKRGLVQEVDTEGQGATPNTNSESLVHSAQSPHPIPQSASESLFEADALFSRIMSKRSENPDPSFTHVPISARILNAYIGVYLSHASLQQALDKHSTIFEEPGMPGPNIYSFIALLERLACAAKPDRPLALNEAKKVWQAWLKWIEQVDDGSVDSALAEVTPRGIERAWAAIIKVHSLCDEIDAALALLREFVTKYPPTSLKQPHHLAPPSHRPLLEHAPPTNPSRGLSDLLTTPPPRVGLLVRFATPEQITEPGVPPHLLFTDLALLHHRLVARHSHRRADIAFVTWVCKSYELQMKRRRDRMIGVLKQSEPEPREGRGKRDASVSCKGTLS